MQGLLFRALREFVCASYGPNAWSEIAEEAGRPATAYDSIVDLDYGEVPGMLAVAAKVLKKCEDGLLEDLGTFIVSGDETGAVRRLLRFTGSTFVQFLLSLDELPERIRLALPDFDVPEISVLRHHKDQIEIGCGPGQPGLISLLAGLIRAMADDYGTLATVDRIGPPGPDGSGRLLLQVHDSTFSHGRRFSLAAGGT